MRQTALILALAGILQTAWADEFVLATFNNGEQRLRILTSTNAEDFSGHAQGSVYTPPGGLNLRDPSIIRHDGRYYVCHTAGNFGAVNFFSILVSDNLRDWSHLTDVSMAALGDVRWTWAPEWFRDDDGSLHILVSASTTSQMSIKHKIYELHPLDPADLTHWSPPTVVEGPSAFPPWTEADTWVGTYDPFVVKRGGTYWMFFFNVRSSYIELARSTNALTGPYEAVRTGDWQGIGYYKEGPSVMYLGGGRWRMLFADAIYSYLNYTDSTNNWATWSTPVRVTVPGAPTNFTVNHGTLITPPGGLHADLRATWNSSTGAGLTFQGMAGDTYRIHASTNLIDWSPVETLTAATNGSVTRPILPSGGPQFRYVERLAP